jgi:iron complex outermembrane receptor protein
MLWEPDDSLSAEYAFDWAQVKSAGVFNQQLATNDVYQYLAPAFTETVWPIERTRAETLAHATYRPLDAQKFTGHRITASWKPSDTLNVKSIAAYRDGASKLWNPSTVASSIPGVFIGSSLPYISGTVPQYDIAQNQFSEELQLTGNTETVKWVTGLFFFNEHASQINATYFGTAFPDAITSGPPAFLPITLGEALALDPPLLVPGSETGANIHSLSYALFGQATWRPEVLESKLSYTLGFRVGRDEKEAVRPVGGVYSSVTYPVPPSSLPAAPDFLCTDVPRPPQCSIKTEQTKVLPVASVAYDWSAQTMSYLRYSTGYQAAAVGLGSQTFTAVKPSSVRGFEIGAKSELFERRAQIQIAAFHLIWKNPQDNVQTASSAIVEYFSGPEIKVYGMELDSSWLVTPSLIAKIGASYLQGRGDSIDNPFPNPYAGGGALPVNNQLIALPKLSGAASLLYDVAKTPYGTWRLDMDVSYTSRYYSVPQVAIPVGAHALMNGRLELADIPISQGVVGVSLWGRNLLNRDYAAFIYNIPAVFALDPAQPAVGTNGAFGEPRTVGGSVTYSF